jgi:hypothetical protein
VSETDRGGCPLAAILLILLPGKFKINNILYTKIYISGSGYCFLLLFSHWMRGLYTKELKNGTEDFLTKFTQNT